MRRLIINADDFGLTAGVNRAIVEAHRRGVVTSTTLMANSAGFDNAVRRAQEAKGLRVGCHVVLVDGQPVLPSSQVRTLLSPKHSRAQACAHGSDGSASNGCFRDGFVAFALQGMRGRLRSDEIEAETRAQIRKIQAAGISVTHIDTHKHVHMLPLVRDAVLRAARLCGVGAVRNPFAPLRSLAFAHLVRRPRLWTRYTGVKLLRGLADSFRDAAEREAMATTDGNFGVVVTGALDEELFRAIVGGIPEGTWELVCHPGYNDGDLDRIRTRLRASREVELRVLTSEMARAVLKENKIELITYKELAPVAC